MTTWSVYFKSLTFISVAMVGLESSNLDRRRTPFEKKYKELCFTGDGDFTT